MSNCHFKLRKATNWFSRHVSELQQVWLHHIEHSCMFLICLSLVCSIMLAQSQKCQTERTAFLCLSPWLGWHSGCGTDGRQLHLSGFLYLLFRNQWLHYHRPVQLHSLAVSWAVCSVCLSACLSFSWAVSNWILASTLIVHCAAFAMSSPSSTPSSMMMSIFNLPASHEFMPSHILTYGPQCGPHIAVLCSPLFPSSSPDNSAVAHIYLWAVSAPRPQSVHSNKVSSQMTR